MKIVLTLKDRVVLPGIFQPTGNYRDLLVRKEILDRIQVTLQEVEKYEVRQAGLGVLWKEGITDTFEYEFSLVEISLVSEAMKKLSDNQQLHLDHLDLYEKFVNAPKPE